MSCHFCAHAVSTAARIAAEFVVSRSQAEYASRTSVDRKGIGAKKNPPELLSAFGGP
jgi:hypothetical protein